MLRTIGRALIGALLAIPVLAQEHGPAAAGGCDDSTWECAREATPAFGPDGSLWVAWSSAGRIRVARSADMGASFGPATEITRGPMKLDHAADTRPQIAVDAGGRATVGWTVLTDVQFQGDVYYAHAERNATAFGPPRRLDGNPAGKRFLSLALDPGRDMLATWVDKRDLAAARAAGREYAGAAVYAAWSRDGGASFGEPLIIQEHTCECCRLAVDFVAPGRPVVVWRNLYGKARDHAIATFAGAGSVGPVYRVSDDDWEIDACPHHGPSIAVTADGSYHVAWFTASPVRTGLFYARSADAGAHFSAPQPIGDPSRQPARPQLLAFGNELWLAWREYDGEATEVVVMHSPDGGRNWSTRSVAGRSTSRADHPLLIGDGARAYVSWLTQAEGYRLLPLRRPG